MPVDTRVASGDTAILKCIPPRGNPKPRLIWLKNGQPLTPERDSRWHVTEVGSLVIEAVQKSDEANYVCRAENMVGSRDSDSIRLNVHGKHDDLFFSNTLINKTKNTLSPFAHDKVRFILFYFSEDFQIMLGNLVHE